MGAEPKDQVKYDEAPVRVAWTTLDPFRFHMPAWYARSYVAIYPLVVVLVGLLYVAVVALGLVAWRDLGVWFLIFPSSYLAGFLTALLTWHALERFLETLQRLWDRGVIEASTQACKNFLEELHQSFTVRVLIGHPDGCGGWKPPGNQVLALAVSLVPIGLHL